MPKAKSVPWCGPDVDTEFRLEPEGDVSNAARQDELRMSTDAPPVPRCSVAGNPVDEAWLADWMRPEEEAVETPSIEEETLEAALIDEGAGSEVYPAFNPGPIPDEDVTYEPWSVFGPGPEPTPKSDRSFQRPTGDITYGADRFVEGLTELTSDGIAWGMDSAPFKVASDDKLGAAMAYSELVRQFGPALTQVSKVFAGATAIGGAKTVLDAPDKNTSLERADQGVLGVAQMYAGLAGLFGWVGGAPAAGYAGGHAFGDVAANATYGFGQKHGKDRTAAQYYADQVSEQDAACRGNLDGTLLQPIDGAPDLCDVWEGGMLAAATVNTAVMGTASRVNEGIDWIDDQGQDAQRAALDWLRGLGTDAVDLAWDLLPDDTEMERDLDRAPCETEGGSTMGGSVVDGCVQALEDGATLEELAEPSFIEEYLQDGNSERGDEQEDDENEELRRQLEEDQFEEAMNGST